MRPLQILVWISASLGGSAALGQSFDSGSNGSFGPINIVANQTLVIPLPPDGIIHATTVTLGAGSVLRFTRNDKNTPVYLLATGDVVLAGVIDVGGGSPTTVAGGLGGPGGFDGGVPGIAGAPGGDGLGPGGGRAGSTGATAVGGGSYGSRQGCTNCGEIYGSQLMFPMLGGSGGGARTDVNGTGGGGGGGALLLASSTKVTCSRSPCIDANGGSSTGGGGSGGAVRVVAPRIDGTGSVVTSGGSVNGGFGRVRFDLIDRSGFGSVSFSSSGAATVSAYMQTFPTTTVPRLDFTNVAGIGIPDGSDSVTLILPFDAPAAQTITLRARDFTGVVPVRVVLTPVSGSRIVVDDTIDMAGQASATKVINVTVPQNVAMRVHAWTR